ncbi:MAG: serpin family protein [Myxococcales bacterium]|nr:serpin family protein [Myxococcales bacterium]
MRSLATLALASWLVLGCTSAEQPLPNDPAGPAPAPSPLAPVPPGPAIEASGTSDAAVRAANAFGLDLYERLRSAEGNLAFSPASIALALAMTYAGARGETAQQMRDTLHLPADGAALHAAWASVLAGYQALVREPEAPTLRVVDRLFGERSLRFDPAFLELTARRYGGELAPSDFLGAAEAERARINDWVAEQTAGRITDLMPLGSVSSATSLVLVNALYLKASWAHPFDLDHTRPGPFASPGKGPHDVPLMREQSEARYAATPDAELCELAYRGGRFATLFVLPKDAAGLAALEARLDAAALASWVAALGPTEVDVTLPRFRLEPAASLSLGAHLAALGMPLAFGAGADFSGVGDGAGFHLDDVVHKAFVAMDEAGTEAAAATATAMTMGVRVPRADAPTFVADHPFLFFVRDTQTGLVLFAGRVVDP